MPSLKALRGRQSTGEDSAAVPWVVDVPGARVPLPSTHIDDLVDGSEAPRAPFRVHGWAMLPDGPPVSVELTVDGVTAGHALVGQERPDLVAAVGLPEAALAGFEHTLDLSGLAPTVTAVVVGGWAYDGHGRRAALPSATLTVVEPPERGVALIGLPATHVDDLVDGEAVPRAFVRMHGWVVFPDGPADRIDVTVDGVTVGRARTCMLRPALREAIGLDHAELGGFEYALDLSEVPADVETIELGGWAYGPRGERIAMASAVLTVVNPDEDHAHAPFFDLDGRAAELRQRTAALVPARPPQTADQGDRPAHVLVVTHHLGLGGGQLVLLELLERLAAHGTTGAVVAPADGATRKPLEAAGFPVQVSGALPCDDMATYEGRMAELVAWAVPQSFDVVLVNTLGAFAGADLAERLGLRAVWILHESYGLGGFWATFAPGYLHSYVRERAEERFQDAAAMIFEANATRELFEPDAGASPCLTLPYGIDIAAHDAWRRDWSRERTRQRLGVDEDELIVLCIGTIEPRKSQAQLVEAFSRVAGDHPSARLVLVGSREDGYERGPELAAEVHQLEDRVTILPILPDVRPWYAAADLLVCASDVESLPRTVLEAMAHGLPVLATDVFGLPDVVHEGKTGWLCESRDTTALTEALARALGTPADERRRLARGARELIALEHNGDLCAVRYDAVMRAAVNGTSVVEAAG